MPDESLTREVRAAKSGDTPAPHTQEREEACERASGGTACAECGGAAEQTRRGDTITRIETYQRRQLQQSDETRVEGARSRTMRYACAACHVCREPR